jgi:hypothetical protein
MTRLTLVCCAVMSMLASSACLSPDDASLFGGGPAGKDVCPHDPCVIGEALAPECGVCPNGVCETMPSCCSTAWDEACVTFASWACTVCRDGGQ